MLTQKLQKSKASHPAIVDWKAGLVECPHCGNGGPHDDNGATRRFDVTYLCCECEQQFDLAMYLEDEG